MLLLLAFTLEITFHLSRDLNLEASPAYFSISNSASFAPVICTKGIPLSLLTCSSLLSTGARNQCIPKFSILDFSITLNDWFDHEWSRVTAADLATFDKFGSSISASGDYIAVGAPNAEAVYLYRKNASLNPDFISKISPTGHTGSSGFGYSVSLHGQLLAVGASTADPDDVTQPGDSKRGFSDGSLTILSSNYRANSIVKFRDMFPISLTSLEFDASATDIQYFTAEATFKYTVYIIVDSDGRTRL